MFDIGWSELVVIAVVALVVIGPKELPTTLRTIGKMTARARKVAGEFRAQFDEAMREAELDDVRQTIADAQKLNPMNSLREAMNPLRDMGNEIKADLQRVATPDKAASAATPLPSEPVPGVSSGLPEALAATSTMPAASSNPPPAAAPEAPAAVVPQPVAAVSEAAEKPKTARKPRAKTPVKGDEVAAAAVVQTPVVTEKPKRAPRKVAVAAAVEKTPPAPRKRPTATASKATPKTPKKKDQA
ncbi:Sec-independent protein translocase protein TatB [Rhizobium sp. LEGMi135b]